MDEPTDPLKPQGAPPPWLAQFEQEVREAMAQVAADEAADPDQEMFDPPEGVPARAGQTHATFLKKPTTP